MSTITEELQRIITAKSDIKQAIEDKGVTVGDIKIDGYAELISLISGGSPDTPIIQYEEYTPTEYTVLDHSDYYGSDGTTGNSFPPYLAFDNNMSTRALLISSDKNFYITFSIDKKISPLVFKIAQGFYPYRYVTSAKIYGLNDNNEYELITIYSSFAENKTLLSEASGYDTIFITTGKKYDTYKIEFVGQPRLDNFISGKYAIQLWEIQLTGLIEKTIIPDTPDTPDTPDIPDIPDDDPLTFIKVDDVKNGYISINSYGKPPTKAFQYNKNDEGWITYKENTPIFMEYGDKVLFKSLTTAACAASSSADSNNRKFITDGIYKCGGNINSLINFSDVIVNSNTFSYLFSNTNIISAPVLPATTLASSCYSYMFENCYGLTNAPVLPATTLTTYCYYGMFSHCYGLTDAPELPATELASGCYSNMFSHCYGLIDAPELPATTLASSCYISMFSGCTSLVNAPELPATTLVSLCYLSMFYGCTNLVNVPALPATTLASNCCYLMFYGCTSLVNAPELPATELASNCYYLMFYNCKNLKTIYCNARYSSGTTSITTSIGSNWLYGVPNTTECTFYKNADWSGPTSRSINTIPSNWKIVNWEQ